LFGSNKFIKLIKPFELIDKRRYMYISCNKQIKNNSFTTNVSGIESLLFAAYDYGST